MTRISVRLIAAAAAATLTIGLVPAASATSATSVGAAPPTVCQVNAFGRKPNGHLAFRRAVDTRTTLVRTTASKVSWTPLAWGILRLQSWADDQERGTYIVPATDGRLRVVETFWRGRGNGITMSIIVKKSLRWSVKSRLVAATGNRLYYVASDGSLQRRSWNGRRISDPVPLKVKIPGAKTITVIDSFRGYVVYLTDRKGQLHLVDGSAPLATRHVVLRATGYAKVTGLKAGYCMSPNYANMRDAVGLLQTDRATGRARAQRHWFPGTDKQRLGTPRHVDTTGWNWRYLG